MQVKNVDGIIRVSERNRRTINWFSWILLVVMLGVFIVALVVGLRENEKAECWRWKIYAAQYPDFYLTYSEAKQCQALGIPVGQYVNQK